VALFFGSFIPASLQTFRSIYYSLGRRGIRRRKAWRRRRRSEGWACAATLPSVLARSAVPRGLFHRVSFIPLQPPRPRGSDGRGHTAAGRTGRPSAVQHVLPAMLITLPLPSCCLHHLLPLPCKKHCYASTLRANFAIDLLCSGAVTDGRHVPGVAYRTGRSRDEARFRAFVAWFRCVLPPCPTTPACTFSPPSSAACYRSAATVR